MKFNEDKLNIFLDKLDLPLDIKLPQNLSGKQGGIILENLEILSQANIRDKDTVNSFINLPINQQNYLIDYIDAYPKMNLSLALKDNLKLSQFNEYVGISYYNHELEYGNLKDTGKYSPVNIDLIKNHNLDAKQLIIIQSVAKESLDQSLLFIDDKPLSSEDMYLSLKQQRREHSEKNLIRKDSQTQIKSIPDFTVTKNTTANDVLEHYAKINAKVVEEARSKGWITYHQKGFMPSHVKINAEPKEIAKQLEKITGVTVKIDSELTKTSQNQMSY